MDHVPQPPERIDHIAGQAAATAWRRAARQHQADWREDHGWPAGTQRVSKQKGGGTRPLGSRVDTDFALEHGVNFLNDATRRAVVDRIANPQLHQTFDSTRLYGDLLSSMPMCFNLLGPLWDDPELAAAVTHRWFPDLCPSDARVSVGFEWSPGRSDPKWLGDRTAFDAVLDIELDGERRLVGIETKYHEYPITEAAGRLPRQRYLEVTERADLFEEMEWLDTVWGTDLEQVWRDHLLALACQQEAADIIAVRYVLLAPAMNPPWALLAERYTKLLKPEARATFEYVNLDALLDTAADLLPHAAEFQSRYLDVNG